MGRDLSLPALPSHSSDCIPPKSIASGIGKRPAGRAAGKGGRKKASLPAKFFLSKPNATAWMNEQLVAVNQGGWAIKTTDIFIYWYVDIEGEWLSEFGKKEARMSTILAEDVGNKYKFYGNAPAWARDLPDHF